MPAPDGGDNFIRIGSPGEGLRVVIGFGEEAIDGGLGNPPSEFFRPALSITLEQARRGAGLRGTEEMAMWQPDGWGWRARIGVLTPHADIGPEAEFQAMAPDGVSIHATRVPLGVYAPGGGHDRIIAHVFARAFAEPPFIDDAAELLAAAPLHAIVYGFTSSSYVCGPADDAALRTRLETRTRGIPWSSRVQRQSWP